MPVSSNPLVSVVVAIYNGADKIERCLRQLRGQTLENIEIICVDDGSTDGSGELLDEIAARDARVRVIHQTNGGAGAARNAGLDVARGKYLSFLDVDDVFKGNMLERGYNLAEQDQLDIVVFRADEYYPETDRYKSCAWTIHENLLPDQQPFAGLDVKKDIFKVFVGWAWDKLFLASFVRDKGLRFQEIRTTNDMLFVFSAVVAAKRIGVMHDVLVHHCKEEGSLSVTREKSWHCYHDALCALKEQLKQWDLFGRFERDYVNYCVHASLWNVNSLKEPTRSMLIEKLANEWAEEFGILAWDQSQFYNKKEIREFLKLIEDQPSKSSGN